MYTYIYICPYIYIYIYLFIYHLSPWFLSRCQRRSLRKALHGCVQALLECLGLSPKSTHSYNRLGNHGKSKCTDMYWIICSCCFLMPDNACFVHHIASKRQKPSLQWVTVKICKVDDRGIWHLSDFCGVLWCWTQGFTTSNAASASTSTGANASSCSKHVAWHPNNSKWPHVASILVILYTQQKGLWPNT